MKSELDKIYEEEYEERVEKRFAMGREEGIVMGREEEKSAIVQKMKNVGIPIDLISRCTGLSSGEIQAI